MSNVLVALIVAASALLACWALWFAIRDRAVILRQLWVAAVVEAALLVQIAVAAVVLAGGTHDVDPVTFWGYLVTILFILPIASVWAFAERTRWSSIVLMLGALTVAFLELRLVQIWGL